MIRLSFLTSFLLAFSLSPAFAQEMDEAPPPDDDLMADEAVDDPIDTSDVAISDAQADAEDAAPVDEIRSGTDPFEEPSESYLFLGVNFRQTWTPGFILGLFLQDYTKASNPGFGLELTYRKAGFDIITSIYYQRFGAEGPFRGNGDPETEVEIVDSNLYGVFAGVDLLWGTEFTPWFSIQYGLGLGVGVIAGNLRRTEASPRGDGTYEECTGPGTPMGGGWCDDVDGDGDLTGVSGIAAKWTDGGSVPNVYLRASVPHIALRFKPIHQMLIRVDGGFDIFSGFFVGGALAYGF